MSFQRTVTQLLGWSRKRADQVGNDGLSDADLQAILAENYNTLYTEVCESGHRHFESTMTVSASGAASYTLPTDLLGTVRIERVLDTAGRSMPIREISVQEQTYWRGLTGSAYRAALAGQQLFLLPTPPSGDTYKVYYIPTPPDLTTNLGSDSVDMVVPAGLRYLVNQTAADAKAQAGGDPSYLAGVADKALVDVVEWAALRAFVQAPSPFVEDYDLQGLLPNSYDYGAGWWNRPK
jgi:hypothetical protein